MSLFSVPFESVKESDLQRLISEKVRESKCLDYKECLPGDKPEEKREFLADVSSFANTAGGDLLLGMKEKEGFAVELCGLGSLDLDAARSRLENMIRDGIDPRIHGVGTRDIPLGKGNAALLIRVPRSYAQPHMVTFSGHRKFYGRSSNGKYPLDVSELRVLFTSSDTVADRIRNFRYERIIRIRSDEGPVRLTEQGKIILHLIPYGALGGGARCDLSLVERDARTVKLIYAEWNEMRYNLDGLLFYGVHEERKPARGYLQIFRNGAIEAVDALFLNDTPAPISGAHFEQFLIEAVPRYLSLQRELGVAGPVAVMLTLLGIAGYSMRIEGLWRGPWEKVHTVDRDDLVIPEVVLNDLSSDPTEGVRDIIDVVWNAAGLAGSPLRKKSE